MNRPLAIDLFCGLGGWAEGFLAAGFDVAGFDNTRHRYPAIDVSDGDGAKGMTGANQNGTTHMNYENERRVRQSPLTGGWVEYPGQLVIQDVLTLHGSQFRDAAVIVASPPCQNYSYLAMPWSRSKSEHSQKAKAMRRKWETEGPDNRLFDACFRIQREAMIARTHDCCSRCAGPHHCCRPDCYPQSPMHVRYIPLIVENVRGAQPWVGRSAWNYGSFHLWGDVPALMPFANRAAPKRAMDDLKNGVRASHSAHLPVGAGPDGRKANPDGTNHPPGSWFRIADSAQGDRGQKVPVYSDPRRNGGKASHLTCPSENAAKLEDGTKQAMGRGDWFSKEARDGGAAARFNSKSNARKMASAMIAKIPRELAEHIARVYYPRPA